jgi:hypothetical protein
MKNRLLNLIFVILFAALALVIVPQREDAQNRQTNSKNEKPPMYALQIAIGKYADNKTWRGLSGTYTDIGEMKKLLTGERFSVPSENIQTLIDKEATKRQIFEAFENHLIENARRYYEKTKKRDAVILFQYSGHGSQAPDANGDEIDGMDETLVTYDSQDEPGKNYDVTDDEIYALTAKLKLYTDNIVYVLDSCHSGSGTRDAGDTRRLPARKTVPVSISKDTMRGEISKNEKDAEQTDFLPAGTDYIVISASQADQLAGQKDVFECDTCPKKIASYGYLTFYLIEELKNAKSDTSYRELMENVRRKVSADKPTQTPQIEGDANRFVFGGLGRKEDHFLKIAETGAKQITIEAGAMQGVKTGTVFAVYDKSVKNFDSNEGKIAEAKALQIFANRTTAEIIAQKRAVSVEDKAIVSASDLSANRLKVLLDGSDAKLTAADKNLINNLKQKFAAAPNAKETRIVEAFGGKWNDARLRWDVAVLKDNFGKVFADKNRALPIKTSEGERIFPPAEREIFYLAGKDFVPLYGFYVEAGDREAAAKIEKALVHLSRLRSVKFIFNNKSALRNAIAIKPVRLLNAKCADEKIAAEKRETPAFNQSKTAYKFLAGERFQIEIANASKKDLYINVLNVATDASVKIISPRPVYEEQNGVILRAGEKIIVPGEKCRDGVLRAAFPAGTETFKVIATEFQTTRKDFEFLEMDSIIQRGEATSLSGAGDWTTAEIDLEIGAG